METKNVEYSFIRKTDQISQIHEAMNDIYQICPSLKGDCFVLSRKLEAKQCIAESIVNCTHSVYCLTDFSNHWAVAHDTSVSISTNELKQVYHRILTTLHTLSATVTSSRSEDELSDSYFNTVAYLENDCSYLASALANNVSYADQEWLKYNSNGVYQDGSDNYECEG